jgi:HEAT repeat protein
MIAAGGGTMQARVHGWMLTTILISVWSSALLVPETAVAQYKSSSVKDLVTELIRSNSREIKIAIIRELGARRPATKDAVSILAVELKDMNAVSDARRDTVSEAAAEALGMIGSEATSAIPTLIWAGDHVLPSLTTADYKVAFETARRPYVHAITQMGESSFPVLLDLVSKEGPISETTKKVLSDLGDGAIPFLATALASGGDSSTALGVQRWMLEIEDEATVSALVKLFGNSKNIVAQYAVTIASGEIKIAERLGRDPVPLVSALSKGLDSNDASVRAWTCYALGESGPSSRPFLPSLRRLLADSDATVRKSASAALTKIN